jgi:uncharacterized protein (DUF2062 family)
MSIFSRMKVRLDRYYTSVIKPLILTPSPPGDLARGAFVGIFIGLTPTEGFQTFLIVTFWNLARPFKQIRFNFMIAYAMSWVSNYLTMIPLYFLFYYTGAVAGRFLWHWKSPVGYVEFIRLVKPLATSSFPESISLLFDISRSLLAPLFLGCIPYALILASAAYAVIWRIASGRSRERLAGSDIEATGT